MSDAEFARTATTVLVLAFVAALLFGAVGQRTRFCTMGAITDMVVMREPTRMRMWMLAAGTAILGFNAMVALGWVHAADSIYAGPRLLWLSAGVGGLMFGAGMVLASGCTSKNLMRVGTGNLKALVVLLVVAFAGFATLKGATAIVRVRFLDSVAADLGRSQDLPSLVATAGAMDPIVAAALLGLVAGGGLVLAAVLPRSSRSGELLLGGLGIGVAVLLAWYASGVVGFVAENPATLEPVFAGTVTHRMESLSFVAAVSYAADYVLFLSDASKVLTMGIVTAFGVVIGSFASAAWSRQLRWEGFAGVEDLGTHLVGGVLMGVGGVTALGCSVGQGLAGLSTLSLGSLVAVAAMVTGAVATTRFQMRRLA